MWPELSLERFFDKFVVGAMVFLGAWYMHRPFLLEYFPNAAGDASVQGFDAEIAILLFVVGSVALGVLIGHVADVAVVACFEEAGTGKQHRRYRRWFRAVSRPFTIDTLPDPRQQAVARYLGSPRRVEFGEMLCCWGLTSAERIHAPAEAAIVHQHVVARLKASGPSGKQAVEEAFEPVAFAAAIFVALAALVFVGLSSFITAALVSKHKVFPFELRLLLVLMLYCAALIASYSLQRRVRHFCSAILTTALHHFRATTGAVPRSQEALTV
jgi:hypothetical protein